MDALISGTAARLVFIDLDRVSYIEAESPDEPIVTNRDVIPYLFLGASDVVRLPNTTEAVALNCLLEKYNQDRALRIIQILLDPEEAAASRRDAASILEELLVAEQVRQYIENWIFSIPTPYPIDQTLFECVSHHPKLNEIMEALGLRESDIARIREAWNRVPDNLFTDSAARAEFELAIVHRGLFKRLVTAGGHTSQTNDVVIFDCYTSLGDLPNFRQVIGAWTKGLINRPMRRRLEAESVTLIPKRSSAHAQPKTVLTPFVAYQNVRRQQDGVREQLKRGNLAQATRFAEQLVRWQLETGSARYAAKSLCVLAQDAKSLHQHALQLQWLLRAIQIAPADGWAHGQAGDAYLDVFRLNEAFTEFEAAVRLGEEQFGTNGIVRVLRASGRLDEALEACAKAKETFDGSPSIHHIWGLYSEILRDMWRLEDALANYEEAITRFPEQSIFACGRAAVLKDLGRLDDALDSYSAIINKDPLNHVAYAGRADIFKTFGRMDDALAAYEDAIALFPDQPVLVCGRADVLRAKGDLDRAVAAYGSARDAFPYEPVAYSGYAETLKDQGLLEDALDAYGMAIEKFPQEIWCRTGRANVLRSFGKYADALKAYDENVRDFPYNLHSLTGRANLLKELGYYQDALSAYDVVVDRRQDYVSAKYAQAAIHVILNQFTEAERLLPAGPPNTNADWIAYHIRGMMLLKQHRFDDALDIFTRGALQVPFYRERAYFENALAITKIKMGNAAEAAKVIYRKTDSLSQVLQIHSLAAAGFHKEAAEIYLASNDNTTETLNELREELAAYYRLIPNPPRRDAAWIFETEVEVVLRAA